MTDETPNPTPAWKPGDVANGHRLNEQGVWEPLSATTPPAAPPSPAAPGPAPAPAPVKKSHTFRNVFLALCLFGLLCVGGCLAVVGLAANSVDKSITKDENKAGGTHNPMTITPGTAFSVDHFDYLAGWKLSKDLVGDFDIKNLKVTNHRSDKDSAIVEIKVWKGTEVLALADCTTDPIDVGTTVKVSCSSTDKLPKAYDKITINDTF